MPRSESPEASTPAPFLRRSFTISDDQHINNVDIYLHSFNPDRDSDKIRMEFHKKCTTEELVQMVLTTETAKKRGCEQTGDYELFEMMGTSDGQTCKERRLDRGEYPVAVQMLWPRVISHPQNNNGGATLAPPEDSVATVIETPAAMPIYRFVLRKKGTLPSGSTTNLSTGGSTIDSFLAKFLNQPKDKEYPDLCLLPELTESTLMENLKERFESGHIYTYIGPILVAVNPFKFFPIYNPKYAKLYQNRRLGTLPPHIFAVADVTYHNMLRQRQNQCIVISGESGSGKTESTNFLLHHLTSLSQKGSAASSLEQTLLCAGPVLEAFGNAVTAQNNNSSRFGKFIQVNYRENGMVSGANVQIYLLEKSRIISQALGERNYHVFYYMLEGCLPEERKDLFLLNSKNYHYLNQNDYYPSAEGVDEKWEFNRLRQSMELVGFNQTSQKKIFTVLSAVLLLGNIQYLKRPGYHSDDNAFVSNEEVVGVVSDLLEVKLENLLPALTIRRHVVRNETVVTRYSVSEANNTRDAMAKCLYNALFHWIVLKINQALLKREWSTFNKGFYIGILDIFGFEDVGGQWNSFEQFCINYANERLQAYFNQHIFQFEQEEYCNQGIMWTNIEYTDNTECLHLMHSKPYGMLSLIDEESSIMKATDQSLLEKLNQYHRNSEYYEVPQKREDAFIIAHYAGKVKYQIKGFREKNKDQMRGDVATALKNSKSAFVRELVSSDPVAVYRWAIVRASFRALFAFRQAGTKLKRTASTNDIDLPGLATTTTIAVPKQPRRGSDTRLNAFLRGELGPNSIPSFCDTSVFPTIVEQAKKGASKASAAGGMVRGVTVLKALLAKRPPTSSSSSSKRQHSVGAQFQHSLTRLMESLTLATPYFIRCIKSNNEKIPSFFDEDIILRQLRYTGMLETVRIRRAGYSVRLEYEEFSIKYRIILPHGKESNKEDIQAFIKNHPVIKNRNVQFGHSKIFMRDAEKLLLDDQLHKAIMTHIHTLQNWFRTLLQRKKFQRTRQGVIKIQAAVRGMLARNRLQRMAIGALCIQTYWRGYLARRRVGRLRMLLLHFQALCRGVVFRRNWIKSAQPESPPEQNGSDNGRIEMTNPKLFEIQHFFHKFELPKFDLSNPLTLSTGGIDAVLFEEDDDFDDDDTSQSSGFELDDSLLAPFEGDFKDHEGQGATTSGNRLKATVSVVSNEEGEEIPGISATFILEGGERLKLVEKNTDGGSSPGGSLRRQSLVATPDRAADAKRKLMRRAASTDGDQILFSEAPEKNASPHSPTTKVVKKRSGLNRAKQHLKAFLSGRTDSVESDDGQVKSPTAVISNSPPTSSYATVAQNRNQQVESILYSHPMKPIRMHKGDRCALCLKSISGILVQAYKCNACKQCFHKDCANSACRMPCNPGSPGLASPTLQTSAQFRRKPWDVGLSRGNTVRHSGSPTMPSGVASLHLHGSFSLNRTQQQTDPANRILESLDDLRHLSVFIFKKQTVLSVERTNKRATVVDAIFKKSLREFHTELIGYEAILTEERTSGLKYDDLITTFTGVVAKVSSREHVVFPVTVGVNAFRGFLNEFVQQQNKRKRHANKGGRVRGLMKKRRRSDVTVLHMGHRFKADIVHVPTYCEVCNEFMWHAEKIFICLGCRISCHKKCHSKMAQSCIGADVSGDALGRIFGADLTTLVNEETPVPRFLNNILLAIEIRGSFVEGIYRKSGSMAQYKQVRRRVETAPDCEDMNFDDVNVHVLAAIVKAFLRELTEPLLTYDLYENFLNVSDVESQTEKLRCLYVMVELLPKANKYVLDRLMYHLARIANQQEVNKMGPSNLSVIFAPCLLRRNRVVHAQDQLVDVGRQAVCIQTLIDEKLRHYQSTLAHIMELEGASEKVEENLRRIDDHVRRNSEEGVQENEQPSQPPADAGSIDAARQLFVEQLEFLDKEKDKLIDDLPPLAPVASSEDDCLTSSDEQPSPQGSRETSSRGRLRKQSALDPMHNDEYAIDMTVAPVVSALSHLTKNRVTVQPLRRRRLPSLISQRRAAVLTTRKPARC